MEYFALIVVTHIYKVSYTVYLPLLVLVELVVQESLVYVIHRGPID